jgi:beta-phosphoglucomutase family hydrolase
MTTLGLPVPVTAFLFDLDGVLTSTASVHAAAWKEMFDEFLHGLPGQRPFDIATDYPKYLDGRLRSDGARAFLQSRGIELPEGDPDDPPDTQTISGLGNRKNELLLQRLKDGGLKPYPGACRYLEAVRAAGHPAAVVSASTNARAALASTGLDKLVDLVVDGFTARERGLAGKPAPDMFLAAASDLGVEPGKAAVFEDALSGVEAGRAGGFGAVVGVNRADQRDELLRHGADLVVDDLGDLVES